MTARSVVRASAARGRCCSTTANSSRHACGRTARAGAAAEPPGGPPGTGGPRRRRVGGGVEVLVERPRDVRPGGHPQEPALVGEVDDQRYGQFAVPGRDAGPQVPAGDELTRPRVGFPDRGTLQFQPVPIVQVLPALRREGGDPEDFDVGQRMVRRVHRCRVEQPVRDVVVRFGDGELAESTARPLPTPVKRTTAVRGWPKPDAGGGVSVRAVRRPGWRWRAGRWRG